MLLSYKDIPVALTFLYYCSRGKAYAVYPNSCKMIDNNKIIISTCGISLINSITFQCRHEQSVIRWLSLLGVTSKQIETEVSIMRKLVYHKNVLQLLDWNTAEGKSSIRYGLFLAYQVILLLQSMWSARHFSSNLRHVAV